jgi:uncharacterized phage protein gp47/JayE
VDISGAVETDYNGAGLEITVISADSFSYEVSGSPSTPATGTILSDSEFATVPVESDEFGQDQNQDLDTVLTLQSPIVNIDDDARVDFGELGGGTDQETDDELRTRLLDRIQNPIAHFSAAEITSKAKEVAGVTRVFVEEPGDVLGTLTLSSLTRSGVIATATTASPHGFQDLTTVTIAGAVEADYNVIDSPILIETTTTFLYIVAGSPSTPATGTIVSTNKVAAGTTNVYFMRDNDIDPIPSASEVTTTKNKILEIKPANTNDDDVNVNAPSAVVTPFTFTALSPNTATMQTAVSASLDQFFAEQTSVGVDVDEDGYRAAIFNTVDSETGDTVTTFTLSTPSADITIDSGEIGTLGAIAYP